MVTNNQFQFSRKNDWLKRLEGLIPEDIIQKKITIIGCGSVGSFVASELVRTGISHLNLIDPDTVEWPNITRTIYGYEDVGKFKVEALTVHLLRIFKDIDIEVYAESIQNLIKTHMEVLKSSDLVISAVDDPQATGLIDRYCYALGTPVVFIGLYKGAKGGEVITVIPEQTPCFHCSTGGVRKVTEGTQVETVARKQRDYGSNRLLAEIALGSDIHFVCAAALKIIFSLLLRQNNSSSLGYFMQNQINEHCNYLILGMEPNYFLFPLTHASTVGQYAFQSIWAKTNSIEQCEVCGTVDYREKLF